MDQSGSMLIGVAKKRFSTQKLYGTIVNYSLFKGDVVVKVYLDANKKKLIIFTPQNPAGEVFSDLPKDGVFFPAIQCKTAKSAKSSLRVQFKFEQMVPKNKSMIASQLVFTSDEESATEETGKAVYNTSQ